MIAQSRRAGKLIYAIRSLDSGKGEGWGDLRGNMWRAFWDAGHVLFLDLGVGPWLCSVH